VYLILRPAGSAGGPPLAVRKLDLAAFPAAFEIGLDDHGPAAPSEVRLDVRLDRDGDAGTRSADDLSASMDHVSAGSDDLRLVLRPQGS
jgi:hypothetical protein